MTEQLRQDMDATVRLNHDAIPDMDVTARPNRDPITGAPGAHPVGTGVGALVGGMAAGAAVGTMAGPAGTLIGGAIGAIAGGLAGKGIAEMIDPTIEDAYWRENYSSRPYVTAGSSYNDYGPAYRYGVAAYGKHDGKTFADVESQLSRDWNQARGASRLEWEHAKDATQDSWQRVHHAVDPLGPDGEVECCR